MGGYVTAEESEQEYRKAMGQKLGCVFSLLVNECNMLHLEWAEYRELFGTNRERIDLLNQAARGFFSRLQNARWELVLLGIARLLDPPDSGKDKDNVTLMRLNGLVDPTIQPKINGLLAVVEKKCAFSLDWRKRRIAHRDLNLALKKGVSPLASASRLSVSSALEAIASILNAVESHYLDGRTVAYDFIQSHSGAKALLYLMRDGIDARDARAQRLKSGNNLPEDIAPRRPL